MSTKPRKKNRSHPDGDPPDPVAPPRKARAVRDHSGAGSSRPKTKTRTRGQPLVARRREDPSKGVWTPAIVAIPLGLCALFGVAFMLLVNASTNPPPPPPVEEAPPPLRPVIVDPEPTAPAAVPARDAAPAPAQDDPPDEPAPAPSSDEDAPPAPPIEGDE